jgi:hypothetical protein
MPTLIEIQQALPLYAQLLFYAVVGALVVGTFFSIVGFMFRHALAIIAIAAITFVFYYGGELIFLVP